MSPDTVAKILVVDDNEANRLLAKATLEDEGYEVVLANDGAEGLRVFDKELPDCVLLDVRMPNMDGFAVCERLRALPRGGDTPILFLTALRDVDTFDRARRAGGNDYLTKPIRPAELVVRVQTALELRRMSIELRDHYELHKRQRDDLLRLQLQKERLMAFVIHDLKNPVNTMDLHAQLLLRSKDLSASARKSVAKIRADAHNLTHMILNLLDISKADEGQLLPKLRILDPRALVGDVLSELAVMAETRGASLESAIEIDELYADEDLLRRVLINLAENALRYAPAQTPVSISAAPVAGATEIRITDHGPGVPPEMRDKVFEPFLQLETGDTLVHRTNRGLGLSFCKLAVEAHGGAIWIEDGNPGSVFCVTIPDAP